ncbi:Putative Zinc c2h2 finger domain containing protein [[Torrubiella] hemipterigena]|nr:Putative Zinc c2h2 finger domain containing protein [[Torrubiella] hemipterigena]
MNFLPHFPDPSLQPSGPTEDFNFTSGQTTPKGSRNQNNDYMDSSWATLRAVTPKGQSMMRVDSSASACSSASQVSSMGVLSNDGSGFHAFQAPSTNPVSAATSDPSPLAWDGYEDDGLGGAFKIDLGELDGIDITSTEAALGQTLHAHSSPSSWGDFESSISRTSSPATVDEAWMKGAFAATSPQTTLNLHNELSPSLKLADPVDLTASLIARPSTDGDSPRDDVRYKNAVRGADGLFHCPWEGTPECNHKPEKLKCNYDKFLDSHLKPYRCKVPTCNGAQFSSTACRLRHEREAHGLHGHGNKPFPCTYEGCERSQPGNGFPRLWNLRDHMKRVHNDKTDDLGQDLSPTSGSAKGRKRKSDAQDSAMGSRKAAQSMPPPKLPADPTRPLLQRWESHYKAMQGLLEDIATPGDGKAMKQIFEMQRRSSEMAKINAELANLTRAKTQNTSG